MSRKDCISNRNICIIAAYVRDRLGSQPSLFDGLAYPHDRYPSAQDFFLNEDEWTTFDNFEHIFRRAKDLVDDPDFFFNCGASSAGLHSWGRLQYFVRVFATPDDGYRRLPFFNKTFNDVKDIEVISPPSFDPDSRMVKTILKVRFHNDMDPNRDFIGDPFIRGIVSAIPTIWGLPPAVIRQPLVPYDPEFLFHHDPELTPFQLDVHMEGGQLKLRRPDGGKAQVVGENVLLIPEVINGHEVFLGKYEELPSDLVTIPGNRRRALRITETVRVDDKTLLAAGDIFMAPYSIMEVSYVRLSIRRRISQVFRFNRRGRDPEEGLVETINQLRKSIASRNEAYERLENTLSELRTAQASLDEINRELETRVEERTLELKKAQHELLLLNKNLEAKVQAQVVELERHNHLRRYLSPKLAEKILSSEDIVWAEPQRKMMTVVFTDIRGFSALTDSVEPEELFHLLSRYHAEMIQVIHDHDGTLNKMIGDGLLIFFGDPIPMDDHADRAVRMALDMQKKAAGLSDGWSRYGYQLGVGIGINSGFVTVGNVGSDIHRDYTVIGHQVNVASRLEAMAGPGEILISQRTFHMLKNPVQVEEVGDIQVKGIHMPVKTYRVLG